MISAYNNQKMPFILVLTSLLDNTEMSIRMADLLNPINTIFLRCILLQETDNYRIQEDNGLLLQYTCECLSVYVNDKLYFKLNNLIEIKAIIEAFELSCLFELLKLGAFDHIRSKQSILMFYDDIVNIFFEKKTSLATFVCELRDIFKKQDLTTYRNHIPQNELFPGLYKAVLKFIKNNIDASIFPLFYQVFASKLILFLNSNSSSARIDAFMKNYQLNY